MKFEDDTQNLKARMAIIHGLVIAILAVLGARLYFLQVVNGDYYAERAENQRVRRLRIPAPRGAIFDRSGKLLVDSRSTYNIILSGEDMKGKDLGELVEPLSEGLDVAPDILREHFEQAIVLDPSAVKPRVALALIFRAVYNDPAAADRVA